MAMENIRRMVVKVGTGTIAEESGRISRVRVTGLVDQVVSARNRGIDVALVSSGAIAAGMEKMGYERRPSDMESLQAVAAVGQGILVHIYADIFGASGVPVGQVLLTQYDMTPRQQYLNARQALERLFEMGVVPIVNENDTVATEEIKFGENDLLAALVASLTGADLLVLLTDTAGLHTADPRKHEGATLLRRVERITDDIQELGGEAGGRLGSGGMSSKVQAAKIAVSSGVHAIIADGRSTGIVSDILDGKEVGTYFPPSAKVSSKKHWIGYAKMSSGSLVIDDGAAKAIMEAGKSLLPAGVVEAEGEFQVGDALDIVDRKGKVIGRGLSNYDAAEAKRIMGLRSDKIAEIIGERAEEMIHRDLMVVYEDGTLSEGDE
ncbi:MAG: glutamate 5-kinase [Actinobacteria bacterium]|nr:glutamate 5-kinase [Actinomycetota bacterium]